MAKSSRVINEDLLYTIREGLYNTYLEYVGFEVDVENVSTTVTDNVYGDTTITYETVEGVRCFVDEESVKVLGGSGEAFNRFFEDSMPMRVYFPTNISIKKGSRIKMRIYDREKREYRDRYFEIVDLEMTDNVFRRGGKIVTAYISPFRKDV